MNSHPVVHLELHTGDLNGARAFYEALCGWRSESVTTSAGTYVALPLARVVGGGVVECATTRPLWLPYVNVSDVAAATRSAEQLGARVLLGPREGPAGWRSVVIDPAAGEIALWQQKNHR
jgi:predicted enzyme related to lactoylglutathione lyase